MDLNNMENFAHVISSVTPAEYVKTIFDIGAFDGFHSAALKKIFPRASVYAIEGNHLTFERNLNTYPEITYLQRVIWNFDGEIIFHEMNHPPVSGVYYRIGMPGNPVTARCSRLDSLCVELGVSCIDVAKIDVEGGTLEVLQGAGAILDTIKVLHLETEERTFFQGQHLDLEVRSFLKDHNFTLAAEDCGEVEGSLQFDSIWINLKGQHVRF